MEIETQSWLIPEYLAFQLVTLHVSAFSTNLIFPHDHWFNEIGKWESRIVHFPLLHPLHDNFLNILM